MLKVFVPKPQEDWIVDRIIDEFKQNTSCQVIENINDCDIIFLYARYIWGHFPLETLKQKKVLMSWHHCVPDKFNINEFNFCDQFVDAYWVPNIHTENFIKQYTNKPIYKICYWINDKFWKTSADVNSSNFLARVKTDKKILCSLQRDTEGNSIGKGLSPKPKLEKGSDIAVSIIKKLNPENYCLIAPGWRREYIVSSLKDKYDIFTDNKLQTKEINYIYNFLRNKFGFYLMTSRQEGGPASVLECSILKTKILATDVGIASEILHPDCICPFSPVSEKEKVVDWFAEKILKDDIDHTIDYNFVRIQNYTLDKMVPLYDRMLEEAHNL